MKKIIMLCMLVALVCGLSFSAAAVEFKAKGTYQLAMDYINGGNFMGKTRAGKNVPGQQWAAMHQQRDNFEVIQRIHLQLDAKASENLSGTIFFEVGEQRWGMASQGGGLGADGTVVKLKRGYIDWTLPGTELKLRMGMQGVQFPGFALENPVFHDDVAGITASQRFNDNASLTAFWYRPYNDNFTELKLINNSSPSNYLDNMDMFGLIVPLNFNDVKVTPWAVGGMLGPNTVRFDVGPGNVLSMPNNPSAGGQAIDGMQVRDGLFPAAFSTGRGSARINDTQYASMFWGGVTTEINLVAPWRFQADFIYGAVQRDAAYMSRSGWFGMVLAEYVFDWGTPGLYSWYFSGDDSNVHNGSERLPYIATTNNLGNSLSSFGYRGNPIMGGGKGVLGANPNGTWGVGARIKNLTFMENLTHVLRLNIMGGTNDPDMGAYLTGRKSTDGSGRAVYRNNSDFNSFGTYLTREDMGIEANLDSTYKIYENLTMLVELGYIHLWLQDSVWGKTSANGYNSLNYKDAWKASINFIYSF